MGVRIDMETWDKFELLAEELGYETLARELYNYYGSWSMDNALDSIATDYDIELEVGEYDN
jgi:hypothetical protein